MAATKKPALQMLHF